MYVIDNPKEALINLGNGFYENGKNCIGDILSCGSGFLQNLGNGLINTTEFITTGFGASDELNDYFGMDMKTWTAMIGGFKVADSTTDIFGKPVKKGANEATDILENAVKNKGKNVNNNLNSNTNNNANNWNNNGNDGIVVARGENVKNIITDNKAKKIFGTREGHIIDTPQNRELLTNVANDANNILGNDKFGNTWSAKLLDTGEQVWTQTRNGQIINGGINKVPKQFNSETGLSSPIRPNWK